MGSHGIRNRSPHGHRHGRRMTDSIAPETPNPWAMISAALGALLIVAIWAVVVTLILSH